MPKPPEIQIKSWPKFQHYKRRNPPWIRLYRDVIDSTEWRSLSDAAKALLPELWLLASESHPGGKFSAELEGIAWKTGRDVGRAKEILTPPLLELAENGFIKLPASILASADASTIARIDASVDVFQSQRTETEGESETTNGQILEGRDPEILYVDPVEWERFEKDFRIEHREPLDVALRQ